MQWKWYRFQNKQRRLDFSTGGRWFLLFTLTLGVAAIYSGNNVIYLLESLLLSALLFSGVLSESNLNRLKVMRVQHQASAEAATEDLITLQNLGWFPLFCVEVGEWGAGEPDPLAFALIIPRKASITLKSRQVLGSRGRHQWRGLTLSTSFPFGFARKTRFFEGAGSRLVWPADAGGAGPRGLAPGGRSGDLEIAHGELEEASRFEDLARVHWPSSARLGKILRRPLRPGSEQQEIKLELWPIPKNLEEEISKAGSELRRLASTLVLMEKFGERRIEGSPQALDVLALLPKESA